MKQRYKENDPDYYRCFDLTYEELKHKMQQLVKYLIDRFDLTYEELKHSNCDD